MRLPTVTTNGLLRWRWQFATGRLRDAYEASRSSLDNDLRSVNRQDGEWKTASPNPNNFDEMDAHERWLDHIVERNDETRNALDMVKQGFAVILYHSWERHAVDWSGWNGKYHHGHVTKRLTDAGYTITPGVHKLGKVANCIKHNSAELWKQDETMFKDSVREELQLGLRPDYARNLVISDQQMSDLFDALLQSGPPGKPTPSL